MKMVYFGETACKENSYRTFPPPSSSSLRPSSELSMWTVRLRVIDKEVYFGETSSACKENSYHDLPAAFKFFIEAQFRTIDVDGKIQGH